jgi:uncharacterized membrane protein (Fun14 family)
MIENISTPLVSFAGSGVAGFFMGMFLRRVLKFLVIIIGSFVGAVFLVIQWMQARQYIEGQVDYDTRSFPRYDDKDSSRISERL